MIELAGLTLNKAQLLYTLVFFVITMLLSMFPGKLLDSVGKVLTPVLLFLLVGLAVSVFVLEGAEPGVPQREYAEFPLTKGILEGYNTMDTLASLIFGMLIIDILRKKGVTDAATQTKYLVRAALIAAGGLAFVYLSLFYLGTTAGELAHGAENGGQLLTQYVTHHFGATGVVLLASVVTLACLTTAVGLVSACSEYFNELLPKISLPHMGIAAEHHLRRGCQRRADSADRHQCPSAGYCVSSGYCAGAGDLSEQQISPSGVFAPSGTVCCADFRYLRRPESRRCGYQRTELLCRCTRKAWPGCCRLCLP